MFQIQNALGANHPMGHGSTSEDIANTILFLASEKASTITGIDLTVDCGASLTSIFSEMKP